LEREGRRLLGVVQGLLAADRDTRRQAMDTAETRNIIAETPTPDIGVVVTEWTINLSARPARPDARGQCQRIKETTHGNHAQSFPGRPDRH